MQLVFCMQQCERIARRDNGDTGVVFQDEQVLIAYHETSLKTSSSV